MLLERLHRKRVAIWGFGAEGRSMAKVLHESALPFSILDDQRMRTQIAVRELYGPSVSVEAPAEETLGAFDVVIVSPGISWYRKELEYARNNGVDVTSSLAIWLDDYRDRLILCVTGTKGKSTTAMLASIVLRSLGLTVAIGGNIGVPVTNFYRETDHDAYVVEVSSYQATSLTRSPKAAVLTALSPDHLTWHGSTERYYADKLNLFRDSGTILTAVNATNPRAVEMTSHLAHRVLYGTPDSLVHADDVFVYANGEKAARIHDLGLPGTHNRINLCGAIAGAYQLVGRIPKPNDISRKLSSFHGLPSRLQRVAIVNDVEFVDDMLASNPFAGITSMAVYAGKPLTLIIGGEDRGVPYDDYARAVVARLDRATHIVELPGAERVHAAIQAELSEKKAYLKFTQAATIDEAVDQAFLLTPKGGTVLFSPVAPTPLREGTYADRSAAFHAAVNRKLEAEKQKKGR